MAETRGRSGRLAKTVRIGMLLDLYGGLLTDRQRLFVTQHYDEDLSFGEIARQQGISRQAIHDAVKHAERALEEYEDKLGLVRRGIAGQVLDDPEGEPDDDGGPVPGDAPQPAPVPDLRPGVEQAASRLAEIHERLRASGGIIYNGEGLTREIGETAGLLRGLLDNSGGTAD